MKCTARLLAHFQIFDSSVRILQLFVIWFRILGSYLSRHSLSRLTLIIIDNDLRLIIKFRLVISHDCKAVFLMASLSRSCFDLSIKIRAVSAYWRLLEALQVVRHTRLGWHSPILEDKLHTVVSWHGDCHSWRICPCWILASFMNDCWLVDIEGGRCMI